MAVIDHVVRDRAHSVVQRVSKYADVRAAFLFGSQVAGTADQDSDIDIALFIHNLEEWTLDRRMQLIIETQKELGDDLELHLFPASALDSTDRASFSFFIRARGVALER